MSACGLGALADGHPVLELLRRHRRVLLAGAPGTGKSTLAARAAAALDARGQRCYLLGADPGLPAAGLPGAVCLAVWDRGRWQVEASEALCSLDAARFRLPLVEAVGRLLATHSCREGPLIVDAPGVVRGAAAAELVPALAVAACAQAAVVLTAADEPAPLRDELHAVGLAVVPLCADAAARRPGRLARERRRTAPWDAHLQQAPEHEFELDAVAVVGMPPPRDAPGAWSGRQVGLLGACGRTLAMGEVLTLDGTRLRVRAPPVAEPVAALIIRDARRNDDGMLVTAVPFRKSDEAKPPPEVVAPLCRAGTADGPMPVVRTGLYHATLVNGVFGDPLLHIRLRHQRRSLLFDLGQADRLRARIAHQITDVFVTHAHFDHIGGFPGLLRARIGELPACRLYGPPGLAAQVAGMVSGILWDRAGTRAPRFEITELHGQRLVRHRVTAGEGAARMLGSDAA
ncbi:MAG TPA: Clp1/GlmU family protein, partial [Rhodocyclaceae bacterium]|nr:Clp1/GlmU family protein [Rhodocyclaceae bacterium]